MEEKNKAKKNEKSTKTVWLLTPRSQEKKNQSPKQKKNKNKQLSRLKTINHNDTPNRIYQHI